MRDAAGRGDGLDPRIGFSSDDMVVMQALVVAGLRGDDPDGPPDPPATAALLDALAGAPAAFTSAR